MRAFNWPEIKSRVTVDGVVTVVDAKALAEGRFADDEEAVQAQRDADPNLDHENPIEELFEDQLNCADMVILNKTDLLVDGEHEIVTGELKQKVRAGTRLNSYFDRPWKAGETRGTQLVVIGEKHMDREAITAMLRG